MLPVLASDVCLWKCISMLLANIVFVSGINQKFVRGYEFYAFMHIHLFIYFTFMDR